MLLSFVLDAGLHGMGLDELALLHLGHETIKFKDVAGSGKAFKGFAAVALDKARDYAAEDADVCLRLHGILKPRLIAGRRVAFYETIERPLMPVIAAMERHGIKVDRAELKPAVGRFRPAHGRAGEADPRVGRRSVQCRLTQAVGRGAVRPAEPARRQEGQDRRLWHRRRAAGAVGLYPRPAAQGARLAAARQAEIDLCRQPGRADQSQDGRVHTSYSLVGAATGRLSSTDPNLQNIPIRTEEGRKIRRAFVAEPGNLLLSADYSQIELRLAAHVADIQALKDAFRDGRTSTP